MDILASLMPQAAASTPTAAPTDAPAEASLVPSVSFSQVLSQVSAPTADPLPAVPVETASVAPVTPDVSVAPVAPEPVATPVPVVAQVQPLATEPTTPVVDDVLNLIADEPVASVQDSEPTSKGDTSLDDIRQRMALIESAGQSDTAAMIVVPAIPVSVPVAAPVAVSTAPSVSTPVVSAVQAPSVPVAEDDADIASESLDLPDAMPALVATVADSVPTVHTQTDDRQPDSQPDGQTVFSLAPAPVRAAPDNVASSGLVLSAAIGSSEWAADLGQQMVDMVTRGEQQVDLRLHPAELGPLSISLNLNDGTTQAQFQAAHASVRAAVEQALPQLREALASQGIALGQASVSDQSSRQAAGGQAQRDPQANPANVAVSRDEALPAQVQQVLLRSSGVDLYV